MFLPAMLRSNNSIFGNDASAFNQVDMYNIAVCVSGYFYIVLVTSYFFAPPLVQKTGAVLCKDF